MCAHLVEGLLVSNARCRQIHLTEPTAITTVSAARRTSTTSSSAVALSALCEVGYLVPCDVVQHHARHTDAVLARRVQQCTVAPLCYSCVSGLLCLLRAAVHAVVVVEGAAAVPAAAAACSAQSESCTGVSTYIAAVAATTRQ
eukprot:15975-Heterococcus_DN1.PRE.4